MMSDGGWTCPSRLLEYKINNEKLQFIIFAHNIREIVGTLKTRYSHIQALSQDKEQDVHPRAAT
jgi:hypothetical protein